VVRDISLSQDLESGGEPAQRSDFGGSRCVALVPIYGSRDMDPDLQKHRMASILAPQRVSRELDTSTA